MAKNKLIGLIMQKLQRLLNIEDSESLNYHYYWNLKNIRLNWRSETDETVYS